MAAKPGSNPQTAMPRLAVRACFVTIILLIGLATPTAAPAAKSQPWLELRSPNFVVVTNANEKQARRVAYQFEMIRAVLREYFGINGSGKDQPIIIIAAKDEDTLKTLLPEFWAKKGSGHPAGIYLRGTEKNYIALRLDVSLNQSAYEPYEPVYHEYVHYFMRRLISRLPLWMVEGLAEFYGNTRVESNQVYVGAPSNSNVMVLRQRTPLPIRTLFDVNASSPYYHEEDKVSIFYAESWALTHYLIVRDGHEKTHRVNDFIALLGQNVAQVEAAHRTIGDPETMERALDEYIHKSAFNVERLNVPAINENDFAIRPISDAESLAVRAGFMTHDRHYPEAQQMLEESLRLDPKLASAYEEMGLLYQMQGETLDASKWYSQALALDSQSYVANYYYAVNLLNGKLDRDSAARAESSLRTVLKINPEFAPAYSALAYVLVVGPPTPWPDEAYKLVLQAIEIEPGNVSYRIRAAQVLEHLGRANDAVTVATLAVSMAKTPQEQKEAKATLARAQQFQAYRKQGADSDKPRGTAVTADPTGQPTPPATERKSESPAASSDQK